MTVYTVNVEWEGRAQKWRATSNDVDGLYCLAATLDELKRQVEAAASVLLCLNEGIKTGDIFINLIVKLQIKAAFQVA